MSDLEFVPDGDGGVIVMRDGQPQSHVVLDDPGILAFEYISHFALVLGTLPEGPLAVTHVGGAGLTLPRWVHHTRPGSPQIVLEPDAAMTEAVRRELPLPRGHRIRVRPVDGLTGVRALADSSADAVVVDAYAAGQVPAELASPAFLSDIARVLRPGGLALLNLADEPGLRWVARVAATAGSTGGYAAYALLGTHDVLKGRRFGNTVLVASRGPLDADELRRRAARSPFPTGVRGDAEVRRMAASARPFGDDDALPSPPPPELGRWRVR
ncbi:MAG: fused MFS/spermidine synthase [Micrococcales bacterium]|nr:fused MFS/spermidine synthase [Micrococcales bacterium]